MQALADAHPQTDNEPAPQLRSVELFTGAGGLALGTHFAGFHHRMLLEWNRDALNTLQSNAFADSVPGINAWNVVQADARQVDFVACDDVDLVAGGPPCQPFSIGGKHGGMGDTRDMIPQFVRAVRELAPRAFIMENVRGLLRSSFATYFSYIVLQLTHPELTRRDDERWEEHLQRLEALHTAGDSDDLQYNVVFRVLNAADYGIPQTRQRVFIVGFRSDTAIEWHFPEPTHSRDALRHAQWTTGEYWGKYGLPMPPCSALTSAAATRSVPLPLFSGERSLRPWQTVRDAIADLPEPSAERDGDPMVTNHRLRLGARSYVGHTGSAIDWPAKTLKAGDHGVPGGENMIAFPDGSVRYFTVREAARMQSFPDAWHFRGVWSEAMRQLGNAVPVRLARVVAESVAASLGDSRGRVPSEPAGV
ncbi:MAG: DNA cytosine methyltransferase [Thermomicrobiales bacterium]